MSTTESRLPDSAGGPSLPVASTPATAAVSRFVTGRLDIVDFLRGVAALSVCLYHFSGPDVWPAGIAKAVATQGIHGVDIFFVISGFIIPYAMHRGGYRIAEGGHFFLKRMVRLQPPYLATIVIVVLLNSVLLPALLGGPAAPFPTVRQLLLHVGFLIPFTPEPWLITVFWTLAVEVQFYLAIAGLYPAMVHRSRPIRIAAMLAVALLAPVLPASSLLSGWLPLFMMGIAAFQYRIHLIGRRELLLLLAALVGIANLESIFAVTLVAGATAALLALWSRPIHRGFLFYGKISYPLYLLHMPVGFRLLDIAGPALQTRSGRVTLIVAAFALSTAAAWLLWRFVERPAMQWAAAIRYRPDRPIAKPGIAANPA